MKFLAFTDLHGSSRRMEHLEGLIKRSKPDMLLCAGDITIFGDHLLTIAKKLDSLGIPIMIIPGNHETEDEIKLITKKFKNLMNVHFGLCTKDKFQFFGYGSGGFSTKDKALEKLIPKIKSSMNKDQKLILISHGPPSKTNCDNINKEHVGSESLRKFIQELKPVLVICGHLHECEHTEDKIGTSRIINPGDGEIITLV